NVLSGEKVIHPQAQSVMESVSSKPHYTNKLSKRESEVLTEMAKGKTNKEIAETLFVSEKTVKTHVSHIFAKLQVSDRTQAAIYAMQNNLILYIRCYVNIILHSIFLLDIYFCFKMYNITIYYI